MKAALVYKRFVNQIRELYLWFELQQEDEDTSDVSSLESTPKRPRGRPKKSETPTRQTPGKSSGKTPGKTPGRKKGDDLSLFPN